MYRLILLFNAAFIAALLGFIALRNNGNIVERDVRNHNGYRIIRKDGSWPLPLYLGTYELRKNNFTIEELFANPEADEVANQKLKDKGIEIYTAHVKETSWTIVSFAAIYNYSIYSAICVLLILNVYFALFHRGLKAIQHSETTSQHV